MNQKRPRIAAAAEFGRFWLDIAARHQWGKRQLRHHDGSMRRKIGMRSRPNPARYPAEQPAAEGAQCACGEDFRINLDRTIFLAGVFRSRVPFDVVEHGSCLGVVVGGHFGSSGVSGLGKAAHIADQTSFAARRPIEKPQSLS